MHSTTLLLVRHAHSEGGSSAGLLCGWHDAPLTSLGRKQVEALRERLAAEPAASQVYTSPLRRAVETADAAPGPSGAARLNSLREIFCGSLDGMPLEDVQAGYPDLWQRNMAQSDEDFRWPGGESYRDFRHRVVNAIRDIASAHSGQRVFVFTHAGVISQFLGALSGASAAQWDAFRPGNASITELRWDGDAASVVHFDDRSHLGPWAR